MSFHLREYWTSGTSWRALDAEFRKDYMKKLDQFLRTDLTRGFYPPGGNIFEVFAMTPLDRVSVVIVGRDPYFRAGQATGLAFAAPAKTPDTKRPASLRAIFDEIEKDCGAPPKATGDLRLWAKQGVLLLNRILG